MSTHIKVNELCYVCNRKSDFYVLGSSNTFGSSDLDLRPAPMMRNTMAWWIQECPFCGYVSNSVSDITSVDEEWLLSEEFKRYEQKNFLSKLAEKFYRAYLISSKDDNKKNMYYNAIHAAWVCDDCGDVNNAIFCRKLAIKAIKKIQPYKEDYDVIRADLLRRSCQFEKLIKEYSDKVFTTDLLNKIIQFQILKAKEKDVGCYKVSDVIE